MKPLDRLLKTPRVEALPLESAVGFARDPSAEARVLFLPGDASRPEVTDVAVVLGELLGLFPSLEIGVAVGEGVDEAAMRERFGVTAFPTVIFSRHGETSKRLSRMQSWSTYEDAARALLEERGAPS